MFTTTDFDLREKKDRLLFLNSRLQSQGIYYNPLNSKYLNNLKSKLLNAVLALSELMLKYSWQDVKVLKINSEINDLHNSIRQEIEKEIKTKFPIDNKAHVDLIVEKEITTIEINFLTRKKDVLSKLVTSFKSTIANEPQREMKLSRLQREVESNREIYQTLLQQARGSEIEEALQRTAAEFKFNTIQPAVKPLRPIKPNRLRIIMMAILAGVAVGIKLIYLLEYFDHSFKNVEEVEKHLKLPVLGTIPKFIKEKPNKFY
jgi:uncharacterized protein involved in exopolysaccharide biosynthesis